MKSSCETKTSTSENISISSLSAQHAVNYWSYYYWSECFHCFGIQRFKLSKKAIVSAKYGKYYGWMSLSLVHTSLTFQRPHFLTCVCVCVLSRVQFFVTPWTITRQPPLSMGFSARIMEWVAISSSREFSQPKDRTHVSRVSGIGRQILYHWATWELLTYLPNNKWGLEPMVIG